jgi:hypothetical protein
MIWALEGDDELKHKLRWDITMWYYNNYVGRVAVMYRHLEIFNIHYDPSLFDNEETKDEDIEKFLSFLQDEMDKEAIE